MQEGAEKTDDFADDALQRHEETAALMAFVLLRSKGSTHTFRFCSSASRHCHTANCFDDIVHAGQVLAE